MLLEVYGKGKSLSLIRYISAHPFLFVHTITSTCDWSNSKVLVAKL